MDKRLWVERNKDGSWDAFSDDGAHLKFGKGKGQFTPGDLMKIALAACAALSSRMAVENAVGEGKGVSPNDQKSRLGTNFRVIMVTNL